MKIALPTRGNNIDDHFGHCEYYTILTVDTDKKAVLSSEIIASPEGCGCKSNIAYTLAELNVEHMLAGNIGDGAINVLKSQGINVLRGCSGPIDIVARQWLDGTLADSGDTCHEHECHD